MIYSIYRKEGRHENKKETKLKGRKANKKQRMFEEEEGKGNFIFSALTFIENLRIYTIKSLGAWRRGVRKHMCCQKT